MQKHPRRSNSFRERRRKLELESLERRDLFAVDGMLPLAGDWNGDGIDTPGLYETATGRFILRDAVSTGFAQASFERKELASGTPLAGDWNGDGRDTVGVFYGKTKTLVFVDENSNKAKIQQVTVPNLPKGSVPLAGDWNGDGRDTLGAFHAASNRFVIRNSAGDGPIEYVYRFFGDAKAPDGFNANGEYVPLAGDFTNSGRDGFALLNRSAGTLHLKDGSSFRQWNIGQTFAASDRVFAGDWDGTDDDAIGTWNASDGIFHLRNSLATQATQRDAYLVPLATTVVEESEQATSDSSREINVLPQLAPLGKNILSGAAAKPGVTLFALPPPATNPADQFLKYLTTREVEQLLARAAAASASNDGIIAIVDRGGRILGVRVEQDFYDLYHTDTRKFVFAIDGAIAKARTAAMFTSGEFNPADPNAGTAPLTSRTVRFISQSTITEREVNSDPNFRDPLNFPDPYDSPFLGPGFVAPIGLGGHFPPDVPNTPHVDLFNIEHQGRDGTVHPGADSLRGTPDDVYLPGRFNVPAALGPLSQIEPPDSYGVTSGTGGDYQNRGFATLPGGIGLYKDVNNDGFGETAVGGIGVFYPGPDGYASYEQNFIPESMRPPGKPQPTFERTNAPRVLEAEWVAYAAAGGSRKGTQQLGFNAQVGTLNGIAPVKGFDLPFGRIDLVGITLEVYGPNPTAATPIPGVKLLLNTGVRVGVGNPNSGENVPVNALGDLSREGRIVPSGWLVMPQASGSITAADVTRIVNQGIAKANATRAAIRLPLGTRTRMVFAVADKAGKVLGLYRMPDATVFSIDVAVAKARNTAYYSDATALQAADKVDDDLMRADLLAAVGGVLGVNGAGNADLYVDAARTTPFNDAAGLAFTNRTFRYLAVPRYPSGVEGSIPPIFSILTDPGINITTAETLRPDGVNPLLIPAKSFRSVSGYDAFHPGRNFRDIADITNQNGTVFFPGSTPLYKSSILAGGFGVSGDGVDQDDVVTDAGMLGFAPPLDRRADRVFYRGFRLPFQKFNRNPGG